MEVIEIIFGLVLIVSPYIILIINWYRNRIKTIKPDYRENFEVRETDGICYNCLYFDIIEKRKIKYYCINKEGAIQTKYLFDYHSCFISKKKFFEDNIDRS